MRRARFSQRWRKADRLLAAGEYAEAEALFAALIRQRATRDEPAWNGWEPLEDAADAFWDAGEQARAIRLMEHAGPESAPVQLWLAESARVQDRPDAALHHLERAAECQPDDLTVLIRATLIARRVNTVAARGYLEQLKTALAARSSVGNLLIPGALPNVEGMVLWDEGRHDEALLYLGRAFELRPQDVVGACELAHRLILAERPADALRVIEKTLDFSPADRRLIELRTLAQGT